MSWDYEFPVTMRQLGKPGTADGTAVTTGIAGWVDGSFSKHRLNMEVDLPLAAGGDVTSASLAATVDHVVSNQPAIDAARALNWPARNSELAGSTGFDPYAQYSQDWTALVHQAILTQSGPASGAWTPGLVDLAIDPEPDPRPSGAIGDRYLRFQSVGNLAVSFSEPIGGAVVGGDFTHATTAEVSGHAVIETGFRGETRTQWDAGAEFSGRTLHGLVSTWDTGAELGGQFRNRVRSTAMAHGLLSGRTTDRNRFVVPLRLLAGRVSVDVGYMWIPVYLQLPNDVTTDTPWDFYYPDGTRIPHLIRNRRDYQVRALVYMRPSVTESQEFFVRVG